MKSKINHVSIPYFCQKAWPTQLKAKFSKSCVRRKIRTSDLLVGQWKTLVCSTPKVPGEFFEFSNYFCSLLKRMKWRAFEGANWLSYISNES